MEQGQYSAFAAGPLAAAAPASAEQLEQQQRPGNSLTTSLPGTPMAVRQHPSEEATNGPSGRGSAVATTSMHDEHDEEDDEVLEQAPGGRYSRYSHQVGRGRFKTVYKGFDEQQGIDVAWSKISADANRLTPEQIASIIEELSKGLSVDHPHIIKCYKCWEDPSSHCINFITEYFTSGNLRDYRQRHKHLGMKAVKKWGRQILQGLAHLHERESPIVHGDLRCDKIYINGHTGEIKIGDLGLATLLSRRYAHGCNGGAADGVPTSPPSTVPDDVFAFGLCMLELVSLKKLDYEHCVDYQDILSSVGDEDASEFVAQCLAPVELRPTTRQLLDDPFLSKRGTSVAPASMPAASTAAAADGVDRPGGSRGETDPGRSGGAGLGPSSSAAAAGGSAARSSELGDDVLMGANSCRCEVGVVRGEDYTFQFSGTITDGTLYFRLHMQYEGDEGDETGAPPEVGKRTIDFVYDPEVDTPEAIADEISGEFELSSTDRDICAAALKEWLANNAPDPN